MKITADVISDLWPLYAAGEAAPDTRVLVEDFLTANPGVARRLRGTFNLPAADIEASAGSALGGIVRLGADDAETMRWRAFTAAAAWAVYLVSLRLARRKALRVATPKSE